MKKLLALILALACCIPFAVSCKDTDDDGASSSLAPSYSSSSSQGADSSNSSLSSENSSSSESSSSSENSSSNESSSSSESSSSNNSSSIGETYQIYYYMRRSDWKPDKIPVNFYVSGGRYPQKYTEGIGATVDNLKDKILYNNNYYIEFLGWYLDLECKIPFDGTIDPDQTGDISLYAKTKNTPLSTSVDSSGWVGEN